MRAFSKAAWGKQQRETFLSRFREQAGTRSLLGFCVLGGIFSEGIDLKGESLIGAAIVGTGLPQICHEREILRQYYEGRQMDGFAYAYRYPGMNKVSAGRRAGHPNRGGSGRGIASGRPVWDSRVHAHVPAGVEWRTGMPEPGCGRADRGLLEDTGKIKTPISMSENKTTYRCFAILS